MMELMVKIVKKTIYARVNSTQIFNTVLNVHLRL